MKRFFIRLFQIILILLLLVAIYAFWRMSDRHPGFKVDLKIQNQEQGALSAGFSALPITPTITDTWIDSNEDAVFNTEDGDRYQDVNKNGKFDAVWMAGFQKSRPAQKIHDPLWARAMVIDDGQTRIALVVLDLIGYMADDIISIRKAIPDSLGVDYCVVSSTHSHEGPDMLGLWGPTSYQSGVNKKYRAYVKKQCQSAIQLAVEGLRPAKIKFAKEEKAAAFLVGDTRKPFVHDPGIYLLQAIDRESGKTLGSFVSWSNHPETLWNENLEITSDFVHYLREGMERGIFQDSLRKAEGLGGVCVFFNGSIGGLMTTHPGMKVLHPFKDTLYREPNFEKAEAQGIQLTQIALKALQQSETSIDSGAIQLRAKTIELPLDNSLYQAAVFLGVIDRGLSGWMKLRTEVAHWKLGPATFLHQPGEIYPEIVNGGIESPRGQDYLLLSQETPPLREQLDGEFQFVLGMSNDMIGYIIPKSQWDAAAPFTFDQKEAPYGEMNSCGPNTAPIIHKELLQIIKDLRTNLAPGK